MALDSSFRSVQTERQIRQTIDYLAEQDLGYPGYHEWIARSEPELFSGYKKAALVYCNGIIVGCGIWQRHKQLPVMEWKNIRISPPARGKYLGRSLIGQVESEIRKESCIIIGDARETQTDIIGVMQSMGYQVLGKVPLYEEDKREVILCKCFDKNFNSGILSAARSAFGLNL
jgi:N-acetylglutamate synthase-like GNAT family acetyltransferase